MLQLQVKRAWNVAMEVFDNMLVSGVLLRIIALILAGIHNICENDNESSQKGNEHCTIY